MMSDQELEWAEAVLRRPAGVPEAVYAMARESVLRELRILRERPPAAQAPAPAEERAWAGPCVLTAGLLAECAHVVYSFSGPPLWLGLGVTVAAWALLVRLAWNVVTSHTQSP